jgi:hypothetical protein
MAIVFCSCLNGCPKCRRDGFKDVPFATMMTQGTKKNFNHSAEDPKTSPQQIFFPPAIKGEQRQA